MCIIPEGEKGWFHIVDDLRGVMILYILEKREQLINLEPNILWKKFNNHSYRYLQYKYWQKSMRETQFQVGDATQRARDYSEEELEERYSDLSEIPPQILKLPNDLIKNEKPQDGEVTVTTFKDGEIEKVKEVNPKKDRKLEKEHVFIPETKEEKEYFISRNTSEDEKLEEERNGEIKEIEDEEEKKEQQEEEKYFLEKQFDEAKEKGFIGTYEEFLETLEK